MPLQFRARILLTAIAIFGISLGGLLAPAYAAPTVSSHVTVRSSNAQQPQCGRIIKTFPPPRGFDPVTATASQLRTYGFPPRPSGSPKALAAWTKVFKHFLHYVPPKTVCSSVKHTTFYSCNWAGHVVPKSDYGNNSFTYVQSQWNQPAVGGNPNYTNYQNAPDASFWAGMGKSDIIQDGADSIATATPTYKFWLEDYPLGTMWFDSPSLKAGDGVFVSANYIGGHVTDWQLGNLTTNKYTTISTTTPNVGESQADFINERLGNFYLPNFGTVSPYQNYFAQGIPFGQTIPLSTTNDRWNMTSDGTSGGLPLSEPDAVGNNTQFDQVWYNRSPHC